MTLEHQVPLLLGLIVPSPHGDLRARLRPPRGTSVSLSMEGTRDKERNRGTKENGGSGKDPGTREPSGRNEGDREYVCSLIFLGAGPVTGSEGATRQPGGGDRCPGCPG